MADNKKRVCIIVASILLFILSTSVMGSDSDGCGPCKQCTEGLCFDICWGVSFSCGCTSCVNCDAQDGCVGTTYYDYSCSGTACASTTTANDPRCGEVCSTPGDEDGNGECDYDASVCSHGDVVCPVGVTAISVSNPNPLQGSSITVGCTSTVYGVDSIDASIDGIVGVCSFNGWIGNVARFTCTNLGLPGVKTVRCSVNTSKSYKSGSDQTTAINVLPSVCSGYSLSSSCEADSKCDWCSSCVGVKYTGGVGRCVNAGVCPVPYCWLGQCGASCDSTSGGCVAPSTCDLTTCSCVAQICSNECSPAGSRQCFNSSDFRSCGNFDADSCLEWGTPAGCTGAFCSAGDCVPCEGSEVCGNGVDDDCDGLVDCADPDCCAILGCYSSNPSCCVLSDAKWDIDTCPGSVEVVGNGSLVKLVAHGNSACEGKSLRFRVFFGTWLGINEVTPSPLSVEFKNGEVVSTWTVAWEDANPLPLLSSDPQYEFVVDNFDVAPFYSSNKIKVCVVGGKPDDDCDTVPNDEDECSLTPCGVTVGTSGVCKGCSPEQCVCVSAVDCTGVDWSECNDDNQMVRNICTGADTDPLTCCNSQDTCRCILNTCTGHSNWIPTVRDCSIEEEFPFFTSLNIAVVTLLIVAFYIYLTFRRPKNKKLKSNKFGGLK